MNLLAFPSTQAHAQIKSVSSFTLPLTGSHLQNSIKQQEKSDGLLDFGKTA